MENIIIDIQLAYCIIQEKKTLKNSEYNLFYIYNFYFDNLIYK